MDIEKDLNQEQRIQRAHDLCISGFMADSIYNFGELVRGVCPRIRYKNLLLYLRLLDNAPHPWCFAAYSARMAS